VLDQIIATTVPALIGGLLAILGVWVSNLYAQKTKDEKQKTKDEKSRQRDLRSVIEEIFKCTRDNYYSYNLAVQNKLEKHPDPRPFTDMAWNIRNPEMLIFLYLQPLQHAFDKYRLKLENLISSIDDPSFSAPPVDDIRNITNDFRLAIIDLLNEEGLGLLKGTRHSRN
jgi:hypothetical protein